jgi:AcrR family transcriptional regulator
MTTTTVRRPRRDAARSHQLVIDAAREVFGESGLDAAMEQIAARAGVGVGTVYRAFPCKESLVQELVRMVSAELIDVGEDLLADDDGSGLEAFLRAVGQSLAEHRRWADQLLISRTQSETEVNTLRCQFTRLVDNASRAGTIGPDAQLGDVLSLVWGMRGLIETTGDIAPDAWRRYLDVHLAGLRCAGPLSATPPIPVSDVQQLTGAKGSGRTER